MKSPDASTLLKVLILEKESEMKIEQAMLKNQFRLTFESLKPINLIKSTLKQVVTSPELKTTVINSAIGYITGFIAKKIIVGKSHNPITQMSGGIIGSLVANKAEANADSIKSIGSALIKKLAILYYSKKSQNGS